MTDKSGTMRAAPAKAGPERSGGFKPAASRVPMRGSETVSKPVAKSNGMPRHGFKAQEYIVYPAHGVGQIISIEEEEVAGFKLELFVISFIKDKMKLKVPVPKAPTEGVAV